MSCNLDTERGPFSAPDSEQTRAVYVTTEGGMRLRVRRWGAGPPRLVMLHGYGDNADVWEPLAQRFPPDLSAIAPDLRGHGESSWDDQDEYAFSALVADVSETLRAMDARDVVLMGHSLGATIALAVATQRPDVCGLVIVDFGPGVDDEATSVIRELSVARMREFSSVHAYSEFLEEQLPFADPSIVRWVSATSVRPTTPPAVRPKCDPAIARMPRVEIDDAMWRSVCGAPYPKLLVRGACSGVFSKRAAEAAARELNNGRLVVVPRAGHGLILANPGDLFNLVFPSVQEWIRNEAVLADRAGVSGDDNHRDRAIDRK